MRKLALFIFLACLNIGSQALGSAAAEDASNGAAISSQTRTSYSETDLRSVVQPDFLEGFRRNYQVTYDHFKGGEFRISSALIRELLPEYNSAEQTSPQARFARFVRDNIDNCTDLEECVQKVPLDIYIEHVFGADDTIPGLSDIPRLVVQREKEMGDAFYTFYHGHPGLTRIIDLLMRRMHEITDQTDYHENTTLFRMKHQYLSKTPTASDLVQLLDGGPDTSEAFRRVGICTNLSFFGNLVGENDERTYTRLIRKMRGYRGLELQFREELQTLLGVSPGRLQEYTDLIDVVLSECPHEFVEQIFVHKDAVNDMAHITADYGYKIPFKTNKGALSTLEILDVLRTDSPRVDRYLGKLKTERTHNANSLQARLVPRHEDLKNPNRVQIFTYSVNDQAKLQEFERQFRDMIDTDMRTLMTKLADQADSTDANMNEFLDLLAKITGKPSAEIKDSSTEILSYLTPS